MINMISESWPDMGNAKYIPLTWKLPTHLNENPSQCDLRTICYTQFLPEGYDDGSRL